MEEEYISQRQLAMRAGMAETTCRRYLSQFQEYMKYKKEGQRVLYSSENINILKKVADMYSKGLSENQVRERLSANFSTYLDIENEETEETFDLVTSKERQIQATEKLVQVLQDLSDHKKEIEKVDKKHEKRSEELYRQLQQQQKTIEEQQEIIDQLSTSTNKEKNKKHPWWKKLFMKK